MNGEPCASLSTRFSVQRSRISLRTGGVVDVGLAGPKDGIPLVFHHGTPMSLILFQPFVEAAVSRGLRYVSYSRPGYGNSIRQPGRIIADCSKDTEDILDQLSADRCYVIGWSSCVSLRGASAEARYRSIYYRGGCTMGFPRPRLDGGYGQGEC